jgi:hypothetical protein
LAEQKNMNESNDMNESIHKRASFGLVHFMAYRGGDERVACATDEHGYGKCGGLSEGLADQLGQGLILL